MQRFSSIIILISLLLAACEDVVQIETPTEEPRLVIDASFNVYNFIQTPQVTGGVRLTLTVPFFEKEVTPVNDAEVYITNLSDSNIISFIPSGNSDGYYTALFMPEYGIEYQLTVVYKEEVYTSVERLIPAVPIDNVVQGDGTLFEENETEMIISFTDDGDRTDFYLFDLDFAMFLASEDTFYQGNQFSFSYFYEDLKPGQEIAINILGIDERHYNYMNLLIAQSGDDNQGPFQTPPALVKGNIVNETNIDHFPLGYFRISEADRFSIIVK